MIKLVLSGCTPEPIGSYLKALGILRLLGEQFDPAVLGWWEGEYFVIRSELDKDSLVRFFLEEYAPTPIIAPWNGGSGFYPTDSTDGIRAIEQSSTPVFESYRNSIATARRALQELQIIVKPDEAQKVDLIMRLRDELDDRSIAWLDAVLILTADGTRYPPLLGTGGNDGRFEFTNNQMQRLATALIKQSAASESLLRAALFGDHTRGLHRASVGQFSPGQAGGANSGPGFTAKSRVNPWDYILLLEGSLLFAASVSRRLEWARPGVLAYPFSVRAAGTGYGSSSERDEAASRHELWVPLWDSPVGVSELRSLLGEGRAHVGTRPAATGVDFTRAVASLAVDRGITAFIRYGFHVRNGLSYFATPLDRWQVATTPNTRAALLQPLDGWLERVRSATAKGPDSFRRAWRSLEIAIVELCRSDSATALQQVVAGLGEVDRASARSQDFAKGARIGPVPLLSTEWLAACDDGSPEFRIAAAFASTGIREHIIPFRFSQPHEWQAAGDPRVVWSEGPLIRNITAVLRRRDLEAAAVDERGGRERGARFTPRPFFADLTDIPAFIERQVDDTRIEQLLRGLTCVNWSQPTPRPSSPGDHPPTLFSLLKLVFDRDTGGDELLPRCPPALERAIAGDCYGATRHAIRRLRGSGTQLKIADPFTDTELRTRRTAAALLFPISRRSRAKLLSGIALPDDSDLKPETAS